MTGVKWLLGSLTLVALGCASKECVLDDDLRRFAGDSALDCGVADAAHERADIDKCAAAAFDGGQPFIARYERQGPESKLMIAVASNTDGKVKIFRWDPAACSASCSPVTDVQSCEEPSVNLETSQDPDALPINCTSLGLPQRICS